jgi:hypothetical protein
MEDPSMHLSVAALISAVSLFASHVALADCAFRADRSGNAPTAGVEKIVIAAGGGELEVTGSGRSDMQATGRACASTQEILNQIEIRVRREGSTLYVGAWLPQDLPEGGLFKDSYALLDLKVELPNNLPVEVQDSSGDTTLQRLRSLKVTDSSGDLEIYDIAQNLQLQDSSGDVEVERVKGDVRVLSDSSGDLEIQSVGGAVLIEQDSSGDIKLVGIQGNAQVESDSSGSIDARDIGGDFAVLVDSSGGIKHSNVKGRVTTPSTN